MKKALICLILPALLMTLLSACGCKHDWIEADCTDPETCAECGETRGDALGHSWKKATCTAPKTCRYCDKTKGEAKGHTPGPMGEQLDEVKNLRLEEQRCTECDQVLVSETSTLYYSYSDGDLFVFSAESFMERMAYLASENGIDLSYEFLNYGNLLVDVRLKGAISWSGAIDFYINDFISLPYIQASVPGLWCISIGKAGYVDEFGSLIPSEVFELFCMACDPQMDADAFQTLDLLRMVSCLNFIKSEEQTGYGDHNGLQYEFKFYPVDSTGSESIRVYAALQ